MPNDDDQRGSGVSDASPTSVHRRVFALACFTSWLLYLHRYTFALIKPKIGDEWNLDEAQLGLLESAFFLFYTIFQVPLGIAADALGVRFVLFAMIVVWTAGFTWQAGAASNAQFWYARALFGTGQSAVFAALNRIARQWFPARVRTTMQGFVAVTAGRIGGLSANLLFGSLLLGVFLLDWRTAVYLLAILGAANAAVFVYVFRNSPREHPRVNEAEAALIADDPCAAASPPARFSVRQMFRSLTPRGLKNLGALNVQTILSTFADGIFVGWMPYFLKKLHSVNDFENGLLSALPLLGGALGGAMGGALNDRLIARTGNRRWARSGVAGFGKAMAAVWLFTALVWYDNPYVFCSLLFLAKFFGDWSLTTSWAVVTDIGGRATASVFAVNNTVAGIGSVLAPIVIGGVAKNFGWPAVFVAVGITYVLCALSWLAINCTIPLADERAEGAESK